MYVFLDPMLNIMYFKKHLQELNGTEIMESPISQYVSTNHVGHAVSEAANFCFFSFETQYAHTASIYTKSSLSLD